MRELCQETSQYYLNVTTLFTVGKGNENCDVSNALCVLTKQHKSELLYQDEVESCVLVWNRNFSVLFSHYVLQETSKYPVCFSWCNKDNENYCTQFVYQHIPQYCVSCWTQASMSIMTDRIKIARGAKCMDIQLSVQNYVISAEREHRTQSCDGALDMLSASLIENDFFVVFSGSFQQLFSFLFVSVHTQSCD